MIGGPAAAAAFKWVLDKLWGLGKLAAAFFMGAARQRGKQEEAQREEQEDARRWKDVARETPESDIDDFLSGRSDGVHNESDDEGVV